MNKLTNGQREFFKFIKDSRRKRRGEYNLLIDKGIRTIEKKRTIEFRRDELERSISLMEEPDKASLARLADFNRELERIEETLEKDSKRREEIRKSLKRR